MFEYVALLNMNILSFVATKSQRRQISSHLCVQLYIDEQPRPKSIATSRIFQFFSRFLPFFSDLSLLFLNSYCFESWKFKQVFNFFSFKCVFLHYFIWLMRVKENTSNDEITNLYRCNNKLKFLIHLHP